MRNFLKLLRQDFKIQNRIFLMIKSNVQFVLLSAICLALLYPNDHNIAELCLVFLVIITPIATMTTARPIIKADIKDGSMELLLLTFNVWEIVLSKVITIFCSSFIAFLITLPIIAILYSMTLDHMWLNITSRTFLLMQVASVVVLIGCVDSYFRVRTDLVSAVIFPIIIPGIVISGMMFYDRSQDFVYLSILVGIDLIMVPIIVLLSGFLLKNIYNFDH